MNIDVIREYCLSFPDATEGLQWGDNLLFRIRGKIFATLPLDMAEPARLTLKTTAGKIVELLEVEGIERAAYVGRYNWVSLERLDVLPWMELKELIRESYELVAAKAPKKRKARTKKRPIKTRLGGIRKR